MIMFLCEYEDARLNAAVYTSELQTDAEEENSSSVHRTSRNKRYRISLETRLLSWYKKERTRY